VLPVLTGTGGAWAGTSQGGNGDLGPTGAHSFIRLTIYRLIKGWIWTPPGPRI
jgi:hypothetical protein